jgi:hypothetical protein
VAENKNGDVDKRRLVCVTVCIVVISMKALQQTCLCTLHTVAVAVPVSSAPASILDQIR